ncbi:unnamed protein product [Brachionus calyciflorus]|uniref:SHSP domain-containing protein n=1 Tax=Brachionus calyciflorus TaxID=104777 RepID=A0A813RG44_9BILA|nr:unnamed protein product [Brachionus calyciflorus]
MESWMRQPTMMGMGPSTLDVFDPFDELDRMMGRNLEWVNMPDILSEMKQLRPRVPKKWRVQLDVRGFKPKSIKCNVSDDHKKLIVSAHEGDETKKGTENYTHREMKRTFNLPKHCEVDKMVSFVTPNGKLIVEIPQKTEETHKGTEDLFPRIVEGEKGMKNVQMSMHLPESIDPSKVKVTCKDRDLIVQAEEKTESADSSSQMYFYRRSTMPENTDFNSLKCVMDKNHNLQITAPVSMEMKQSERAIPVEMRKSIQ